MGLETDQDLSVMTAKQVSKYFNPHLRVEDIPKRYLMEAGEFLKHFNSRNGFMLLPEYRLSRRTLQFYSSPQVRLLPLPGYRNRHTAHYLVPDHFTRLVAVTALRERHFMPIKLIQRLLKVLPEDKHELLERWPGTVQDLLDAAPLFAQGFTDQDVLSYLALKGLTFRHQHPAAQRASFEQLAIWKEDDLKRYIAKQIEVSAKKLTEWVSMGGGVRYLLAQGKSIGGFSTPAEYLEKMIGSKRSLERAKQEPKAESA